MSVLPLRSFVAALVALCLALSGLAPSVSKVLAAARTAAHDLCLADGAATRPEAPTGHHPSSHEAACALCLPHGGSDSAPPPAALAGLIGVDPAASPDAGRAFEPPCGPWLAAAARGPPGASVRHA